MATFGNGRSNRSDIIVTVFAVFAILLAGGISVATISTDRNTDTGLSNSVMDMEPLTRAEQAAVAGVSAVRGHIECHGITEGGGLPDQYYANGARFSAYWDKINLADSTVRIISTGYCLDDEGLEYTTEYESVIKVDLMALHDHPILEDYYYKDHKKAITVTNE